jgi:hypothetical protein
VRAVTPPTNIPSRRNCLLSVILQRLRSIKQPK